MNNFRDMIPASVRKPMESSRFVQTLNTRASRTVMGVIPDGRVTTEKSRFALLPHEPEDARLTGVTRSLERRLLALNMVGAKAEREIAD